MTTDVPARRPRRADVWSQRDYREFVAAVAAGLTDEEVADQVGRSLGGVRSRARFLLDDAPKDAMSELRVVLVNDPDYDWETVVRATHSSKGLPYWDADADRRIAEALRDCVPRMPELAAELGFDEEAIVRRMVREGLAANRSAIVDRLGAEPGGTLEKQARLIRDKTALEVYVLTVTDEHGAVWHTSVHTSREAVTGIRGDLEVRDPDRCHGIAVATCILDEPMQRALEEVA